MQPHGNLRRGECQTTAICLGRRRGVKLASERPDRRAIGAERGSLGVLGGADGEIRARPSVAGETGLEDEQIV